MSSRPPAFRALAAAATVGALLAGCGNARTPPPDITTPSAPTGASQRSFPSAGVSFSAPADWSVVRGSGSSVATISSATGVVGIFRYERAEDLPSSRQELEQASDRLVEAAKARDTTFKETGRARTRVDGLRAIVVRGTGTVAGQPRTIASYHIYGRGSEVVVDATAPSRSFAAVRSGVVTPLTRSMQIASLDG